MGLILSKQYIEYNDTSTNRVENIKKLASSKSKLEEEVKHIPVEPMAKRDLELEHKIRTSTPWD